MEKEDFSKSCPVCKEESMEPNRSDFYIQIAKESALLKFCAFTCKNCKYTRFHVHEKED